MAPLSPLPVSLCLWLRRACTVALVLAGLVMPERVLAYHFFYIETPLPFPVAWRTLPIGAVLDQGPGNFRTDAASALTTWNNVSTAIDMFGAATNSAVNFTGANYLTAWGMPGDGVFEVVCDTDGSALAQFGYSTDDTLGYGPSQQAFIGGQGTITDGFFILNCVTPQSTTFNHLGTMVHELGHNLGLAHSSVHQETSGRLDAVLANDAPTMFPAALPQDALSATLEADDLAGVSELYPGPTFATTYATISGTVKRCVTDQPISGVNVRAVNTSNSRMQISRYSGFDRNADGYYEIKVPGGSWKVIVEVLTLDPEAMATLTRVENDFTQEYYGATENDEANCLEPIPDTSQTVTVVAGGTTSANVKTNAVELAFVVDDTGSMGPDIGGVRATLTAQIARLRAIPDTPFPTTAIVTFKDNVTLRRVSSDPTVLQGIVDSLFASGGGDCPEWSNAALILAGQLLRRGGTAMLFTDADSHPSGPNSGVVSTLYNSKGLRMSTLLSGTCSGGLSIAAGEASLMNPADSQNPDEGEASAPTFRLPTEPPLGAESSLVTFSSLSAATGGLFAAIPGIKTGSATERSRYINVGTNIAVSASLPTVGLLSPGDGPQGTTLDVTVTGSRTNFQAASVLAFSGTGITVNFRLVQSATAMVANITIAPNAVLGFRDVTVTTPLGGGQQEVATGIGAFNVTTTPTTPTILGVSPSTAARGSAVAVTIRGYNTSFTNASRPLFCTTICSSTGNHDPNIVINSVSATSATALVVNLTINASATIAFRNVSVLTGTALAAENVVGPFLVTAPPAPVPRLTSINPSSAAVGATLTVTVQGIDTEFVNGMSSLSFGGSGISVLSQSVNSATTLTAVIAISTGAPPGFRDVLVTTGSESAVLLNGFNVIGGPPTAHPPLGLYAASVVGNVVTLRWTAPSSGLAPTQYVLEGGVSPNEVLASIPTGSPFPIFTFTAPTGAFYVRLHTLSGSSRSSASNEVRIFVNVPAIPSTPANFTGMRNGSSVALSWRNTFAGGAPSSIVLDVTGSAATSIPLGPAESFAFDGVPGGTYTLRLRAVNAAGASAPTSPITLSFPGACSGPPSPPSNFLAYRIGNAAFVVWDPPLTGPAPIAYVLNVSGAFNSSFPTPGRTLSGTVGPGSYHLNVFAVNACGSSATTATQTLVVP